MQPVIALVGRPNVGKSTLFNYLTRTRDALVADQPGVTRDRQYGVGQFLDKPFIVIDTGGIEQKATTDAIESLVHRQALAAIEEASLVFWVVDARHGFTAEDQQIAKQLRRITQPVYVLVNKVDGMDTNLACAEFYRAGFQTAFPIAAAQGQGIAALLEVALASAPTTPAQNESDAPPEKTAIHVAIIGRPNVGKSTLVNRILGQERVLVYDAPGTTRDSIYIPFSFHQQSYVLIDTAGVRRRRSIESGLEQFSVVRTLQAIAAAQVVVYVIDAHIGITEQDLHLLGFIADSGKAVVLAVNQWDDLTESDQHWVKQGLDRRLAFMDYVPIHYISALNGTGVRGLFPAIQTVYRSATRKLSTPQLTKLLEQAVHAHQPPAVQGRRIKLRYAHVGGYNPPTIIIHGNQTQCLPQSYQRYLAGYFRSALKLVGTPVKIELRTGTNPYQNSKNTLTPRQAKRRQRVIQHRK